jgi:DNA primase
VRLLKNFAPRVVLAYDADGAGQAAAERFYAWEQKEQIDISVASFPTGSDPGDLARTDPAALKDAVERARPFLAFRVERVLAAAEMRTPEGRARAAAAAMAAIAEHPNELVRDQYVRDVADRCRIDPAQLRSLRGTSTARRPDPAPRRRPDDGTELEALRLALHRPDELSAVLDQVAPEHGLDAVERLLFSDDLHLAAFQALASAEDVIGLLVRTTASRVLRALDAEARSSSERAVELAPTLSWLKLAIEELDEPKTRVPAASRLVPWLLGQVEEDA